MNDEQQKRREEFLLEQYSRRIFSGRDLSGLDLRKQRISGIDLVNTDLSGTDLRGAHLSNVNFEGTNLSNVKWCGVSLHECTLDGESVFTYFDHNNILYKALNEKISDDDLEGRLALALSFLPEDYISELNELDASLQNNDAFTALLHITTLGHSQQKEHDFITICAMEIILDRAKQHSTDVWLDLTASESSIIYNFDMVNSDSNRRMHTNT